jgi:3'-5' exoribonuclease 1
MIQLIGREFQGRAHSGLDDARNIAFIVQRLLKDGARVIFNEKLAEGNARREDGNPSFSAPVHYAEFKAIQGKFKPNFPQKKSARI